jgi:hypothetical protein
MCRSLQWENMVSDIETSLPRVEQTIEWGWSGRIVLPCFTGEALVDWLSAYILANPDLACDNADSSRDRAEALASKLYQGSFNGRPN